jgi:hypothetical protein
MLPFLVAVRPRLAAPPAVSSRLTASRLLCDAISAVRCSCVPTMRGSMTPVDVTPKGRHMGEVLGRRTTVALPAVHGRLIQACMRISW